MFEKTLIQLMQDVRCDRAVDVDVRKVFPENALDRLDPCLNACLGKFHSSFINGVESFSNLLGIMRLKNTIPVANVVLGCRTDGTCTSFNQWDEDLLQIIPYIGDKNWETPPRSTISTDKGDSIMPSTLQWLDNSLHAMVEEVWYAVVMGRFICDVTEFGCWEICQQDLALSRRLLSNVLSYITNGEVDRVSLLAAELHELGFVGWNYDWYNGDVLALSCGLDLLLKYSS